MSLALQLAQASQDQHRRYRELFGSAPVSGEGWQQVATRIRGVAQEVEDLRTSVVASDFSTTVVPSYAAATRTDAVPFTRSAEAADVFSGVTDSSATINVDGANAIAANASSEASEVAAVPNPDSAEGLATILGIIEKHQARAADIVAQSAAAVQALGQKAANAGGSDAETDDSHIQLVDHTTFPESPIPSPLPDPDAGSGDPPLPVSDLGLPAYAAGSLTGEEARTVYAHGELRMRELNERLITQGLSPEQRARIMFDQRNALRTWTRGLMADRQLAEDITANNPNLTWEDLIARNEAKGRHGDDLWNAIIESSTRSRPSVNDAAGIDPEHPPPLPPASAAPGSAGGLPHAPLGTTGPEPPVEQRIGSPDQAATDSAGGGSGGGGSWGAEDDQGAAGGWGTALSSLPREELEQLARTGDPAMRVLAQMILQSPEYQARNPPPTA
ncbi:hypothetical protein [Mycolicibacterium neoaurum]|uniref:hypothetical protein n=1 Tax=Mycolicibacterium neoaurum TaxID=1795 RepID=UPI001F4CE1BC|nr:hypothetical protein [Mycolicibacterium neoaurum]